MSIELVDTGSPITLTAANQDIGVKKSISKEDKGTLYIEWTPVNATSVLNVTVFTSPSHVDLFGETKLKDTDVATGLSTMRTEIFQFLAGSLTKRVEQVSINLADGKFLAKALETVVVGGAINQAHVQFSNKGKE